MIIPELVEIDYTNYEGKRAPRVIWPKKLVFKSTMWHPEPQWIIEARDVKRGVDRDFAWKDVHSMRPYKLGEDEAKGLQEPEIGGKP